MTLFKNKKKMQPKRRLQSDEIPTTTTPVDVFRRNRTLTGTTSSRLNSVGSKYDLESSRTKIHNLAIKRRRVFSVFVIVILSILILWALISNFTVQPIIAVSNTEMTRSLDSERFEMAIQDYLNENPTNRFSFFLDLGAITKYVSDKLPEVSNIDYIGMDSIGEIKYLVTLRVPVAGWKIDDDQYYVDSDGVQFEQNYFADPEVQIIDESGISMSGTAIASKRFLGFVGQVVATSKDNGFTVTRAIIPADTTRQLKIKLKNFNSTIVLSVDRVVGEQIEDMVNAIKYFKKHSQVPTYIDVRVGGKAYYK